MRNIDWGCLLFPFSIVALAGSAFCLIKVKEVPWCWVGIAVAVAGIAAGVLAHFGKSRVHDSELFNSAGLGILSMLIFIGFFIAALIGCIE